MTTSNSNIRLTFSPYAWAKLCYMRDIGKTEVGGWGQLHPEKQLTIIDLRMPKQKCTSAQCDFDDDDSNALFETMMFDEGCSVEQCQRVWIHTHPGNSPNPSGTDENTWRNEMSKHPWAVMFILSCGGNHYARIRYETQFGSVEQEIPCVIDWSLEFPHADHSAWKAEYDAKVEEDTSVFVYSHGRSKGSYRYGSWRDNGFNAWPMPSRPMKNSADYRRLHQALGLRQDELVLNQEPTDILRAADKANITNIRDALNMERDKLNWPCPQERVLPCINEVDHVLLMCNLEWDSEYWEFSKTDLDDIYGWTIASVREAAQKFCTMYLAGQLENPPKSLIEWGKTCQQ